jgi:hypothetical protein
MKLEEVLAFIPKHAIFTYMEGDEEKQFYFHNEDGWCICKVGDPACDPETGAHKPEGNIDDKFIEAAIIGLYNHQKLDRVLVYDAEGKLTAHTPFLVSQRLACSAGLNGSMFFAEFWDGEKVSVPYEVALERPFRVGFPRL